MRSLASPRCLPAELGATAIVDLGCGTGLITRALVPQARGWESWTREAGFTVDDPRGGRIDTWVEVDDVRDGIVSCVNHYRFAVTARSASGSRRRHQPWGSDGSSISPVMVKPMRS